MKMDSPAIQEGFAFQRPLTALTGTRRNPRLLIIGVLCICLGALGSAWAWTAGHQMRSVVIVTRNIPRGQVIQAEDLGLTSINVTAQVSSVEASQMAGLLGGYALVDLTGGSLLPAGAVGEETDPPGTSRVGLRLAVGRLPADLAVGDEVVLAEITGQAEAPGAEYHAQVASIPRLSADQQFYLTDLWVGDVDAGRVAVLGAVEALVMIRLGGS